MRIYGGRDDMDSVISLIDMIEYLVSETSWGQNTTCKKMLQLVYIECRELGTGLSNSDIGNILEEISDVNMMLAYFCCKLPHADNDQIKKLFLESVSHVDRVLIAKKHMSYDTKELYRKLLLRYFYLTDIYEDKRSSIAEVYGAVKEMSSITLLLAQINNNRLDTADIVFNAIKDKLYRRYALYFNKKSINDLDVSEEYVWTNVKRLEKDVPYIYCNNRNCAHYGKLGGTQIKVKGNKMICMKCGNTINEGSKLLPKSNSKKRRDIYEEFEKNLVYYSKGDEIIVHLYVFNRVSDCIDIFTDLICNNLPLEEFILYFSHKCNISREVIKNFLHGCFYQTFAFIDIDKKQMDRANAIQHCINQNPSGFIEFLVDLGLMNNEIEKILYTSTSFLGKRYSSMEGCLEFCDTGIQINLQKKSFAFFRVLTIICEIVLKEKVSEIKFINISNHLNFSKYEKLINYFIANEKYDIKRITYEKNEY